MTEARLKEELYLANKKYERCREELYSANKKYERCRDHWWLLLEEGRRLLRVAAENLCEPLKCPRCACVLMGCDKNFYCRNCEWVIDKRKFSVQDTPEMKRALAACKYLVP